MAKRKKKTATGSIDTGAYDYKTLRVRNEKTGKIMYSRGNSDAVAKAMLLDASLGGTTARIIRDNKLKVKDGANPGTQRMSVGVALRGLINNGTPAVIGKLTVKSLKQKVDLPKVELLAAGGTKKKAKRKAAAKKPRAKRAPKADTPMIEEFRGSP